MGFLRKLLLAKVFLAFFGRGVKIWEKKVFKNFQFFEKVPKRAFFRLFVKNEFRKGFLTNFLQKMVSLIVYMF